MRAGHSVARWQSFLSHESSPLINVNLVLGKQAPDILRLRKMGASECPDIFDLDGRRVPLHVVAHYAAHGDPFARIPCGRVEGLAIAFALYATIGDGLVDAEGDGIVDRNRFKRTFEGTDRSGSRTNEFASMRHEVIREEGFLLFVPCLIHSSPTVVAAWRWRDCTQPSRRADEPLTRPLLILIL